MKSLLRIILVILYMALAFWAIGNSIDAIPFHFADFLLALFAFGGVIYWAEFDVEYIMKFIEWIKKKKNG